MAVKNWAYIFISPGFDPLKNTTTTESPDCRFTAVGINPADMAKVIPAAKQLVADGAQFIELCGGFGPTWVTKVSQAVGDDIPVGTSMYGPEWRQKMLDIVAC